MSQFPFQVTCPSCGAAFSTPFPRDKAVLRCPGCAREAPGRQFQYARSRHESPEAGDVCPEEPTSETRAATEADFEIRGIRGKWLHFRCPHCQWAMRVRAGPPPADIVDCDRCRLGILPPDIEAGTPARLTGAGSHQLARGPGPSARTPRSVTPDADAAADAAAAHADALWKGSVKPLGDAQLCRAFRERDPQQSMHSLSWDTECPEPPKREGEARAQLDRLLRQARIFRVAIVSGIAILAILAIAMGLANPRAKNARAAGAASTATAGEGRRRSQPPQGFDEAELEAARELARTVVSAPDWQGILPHVRHRERVEPIMRDYYSRHYFAPRALVDFGTPVAAVIADRRYLQFGVTTRDGDRRTVGFEEADSGGWLFDWEVFEDVATDQWDRFRAERPTLARTLRFAFMRASVPDAYFADAGLAREQAVAVRVWLRDRNDSLVAVIPKDSLAGAMIDRLGSWQVGKLVIGELAFPPDGNLPDRVRFAHLLQERWLLRSGSQEPIF